MFDLVEVSLVDCWIGRDYLNRNRTTMIDLLIFYIKGSIKCLNYCSGTAFIFIVFVFI